MSASEETEAPEAATTPAGKGMPVIAVCDEIVQDPSLLAAYAGEFSTDDPVTLFIYTTGNVEEVLGVLEPLVADLDFNVELLALAPESETEVAQFAAALYSERVQPSALRGLPRFGRNALGALRLLIEQQYAAEHGERFGEYYVPPAQQAAYDENGNPEASIMKSDWDERARENAEFYIVSGRSDWNLDDFYASGCVTVNDYVRPDLSLIVQGRDPAELRVLDIGCGMGRITAALAETFGEAHGVDVSGEMIRKGKDALKGVGNVLLYETDGTDLSLFADGFFDFVFSFIVFQHIPYREVVINYLRETHRVLKPGSIFKFQLQGIRYESGSTWIGCGFSEEEMLALAAEIGFEVVSTRGAGTQYFWQTWRRTS